MLKLTIATLVATINAVPQTAANETCGPGLPMKPLQYLCPVGDPVFLHDLNGDNWATKSCSNVTSKSRKRRGTPNAVIHNGHCFVKGLCSNIAPEGQQRFIRLKIGHLNYCKLPIDHSACDHIPRSNDEMLGEDPKWVSDSEKEELKMKSSYNLIVNIVNVESPYTNKIQVDGLDQINKLIKSIMLSLFPGNPNAKFLFVLEASNTSQVYTTVTKKDCPSLDMIENGLLTVDSVMDGQKAIPLKLALDLGHSVESWETKFDKLLGYLEEHIDLEHDKIMVNHYQFAKNRDIDQNLGVDTTEKLRQWRSTMEWGKNRIIKKLKMAFHFIGTDAEKSYYDLERALQGSNNYQSIEFKDGNDNKIKAVEFNDDILLLNYESGVSDKLRRPDVFPILKIMKSFIDYDSYFDLKQMRLTGSESSALTVLPSLFSLALITVVAQLLL